MQSRWAFLRLKLFLLAPLPLFLISMEKLNCLPYISFSSETDFIFFQPVIPLTIYNYPAYSNLYGYIGNAFFTRCRIIWGGLIFSFSLVLLKIREISQVIWLRLQSSERTRIAHGHTRTRLFGRLTSSQPSLETKSASMISHPLGSHILQWCHTDAARFTSANLITKQRPWFYQIC